jgi:hypothetical protein
MDFWYDFLDFLAHYAIAISTIISLFLTILTIFFNLRAVIQVKFVYFVSILTVLLSLPYYIELFYFPLVLIPAFSIFLTFYLIKTQKNVKTYATIIYLINCVTYCIAVELAKADFNSWGSGTLYFGVHTIALTLPLFHLLRLLYQQDNLYGTFKLVAGLILFVIIWKTDFPPEYDLRDSNEILNLIRNSIVYSVFVFILEGLLMLFQGKMKSLATSYIDKYRE